MLFRKQLRMNSDISNPDENGSHCHHKNSYWQFSNRNGVFSSSALEAINFPLTSCVSFEHLLSSLEDYEEPFNLLFDRNPPDIVPFFAALPPGVLLWP